MSKDGIINRLNEVMTQKAEKAEPIVHEFIITCDGGALNNQGPNPIGYGSFLVEIPSRGFVSSIRKESFGQGVTNNEAEYRIIIEALILLHDVIAAEGERPNEKAILIRTDSQLVIGHMVDGWKINATHLAETYKRLSELIRMFKRVDFEKVSGERMKEILGH